LAGLLIQLGLGLLHHAIFVRTKQPTIIGRIHFFLGPSIMLLGLINIGVGFNFAGKTSLTCGCVNELTHDRQFSNEHTLRHRRSGDRTDYRRQYWLLGLLPEQTEIQARTPAPSIRPATWV